MSTRRMKSIRAHTGASRAVIVGRISRRTDPYSSKVRTTNSQMDAARTKNDETRRKELENLPFNTRRAVEEMLVDDWDSEALDTDWVDLNAVGGDLNNSDLELSHEGGEYSEILSAVQDSYHCKRSREYNGVNTVWQDRIETRREAWMSQLPLLLETFLAWKHGSIDLLNLSTTPGSYKVDVLTLEGFTRYQEIQHNTIDKYINQTFIRHGLLGNSPIHPSLAVSIKTLELYRICRIRCPQFTIQHWVKVLCDIGNINYRPSLRSQFSDIFDLYLELLRLVDKDLQIKLQHDDADWRIHNSCPACQFKVDGELELSPSILGAMDGNNSLRRFVRNGRSKDQITYQSDYFLPTTFVDQYANEVKGRKMAAVQTNNAIDSNDDGDPTVGHSGDVTCTDRWRAANADTLKGAFDMFEETGIFLSTCRHGIVWFIIDMVRSGELAKYPVAMVSKLLQVLPAKLGIGYDIGCSFAGTLSRTSLGPQVQESALRLVVPAFHGYAHNRICQLKHHILMNTGFGIEDLETCERIFSASNSVVHTTRHATAYHRHQYIEMYFRQWDEDKYSAIGVFLMNNYKQALELQRHHSIRIATLTSGCRLEDLPYTRWLEAEYKYLQTKQAQPEEYNLEASYVDLLQKHNEALRLWETSRKTASQLSSESAKQRLIQIATDSFSVVVGLQRDLQALEAKLEINKRWTPDSESYKKAFQYLQHHEYYAAVDKLEGLVIQRLFEMTKANASGTGYKLRRHISKSLQSRSKAIQRALNTYNKIAAELEPQRPTLSWKEILEYSTIAEFELLRIGLRGDVRNEEWTIQTNREITTCCLKLERAGEEIKRLNVEINHLEHWIKKESKSLKALEHACSPNDPLRSFLLEFIKRRWRINFKIQSDLCRIYKIEGYSGQLPLTISVDTSEGLDAMDALVDPLAEDSIERDIDTYIDGVERILAFD